MKLNILKSLSLLFLMMTALVACSDSEGTIYSSDEPSYAFASALQKVEMVSSDENKILVPVYRSNTSGTSTLELTLTPAAGIDPGLFKLATPSVSFEDGQSVAEAIISYDDINALGAADIYSLTLSFDEAKSSPANVSSIVVRAQRKLTFKSIGVGLFTSTFFADGAGNPYQAEVTVEKAEEANVYRLLDVYEDDYPILFATDDKGEVIAFVDQETGYVDPDYGMISIRLEDVEKVDNTYNFLLRFYVSAGSFGTAVESIEMPN